MSSDKYDEMARELVLRSVNRELKAEAEHHGYTHKPIGREAFEFVHHADLATDVAALVRREVERARAEMLRCEGDGDADHAERERMFKEIREQALREVSGGRLVAAYRTLCGHSPMGIMSRMELAADIDALVDAAIRARGEQHGTGEGGGGRG